MKVKKLVETPDGQVEFEANLNQDELQFIVELGINMLMAKGANTLIKANPNVVVPDQTTAH